MATDPPTKEVDAVPDRPKVRAETLYGLVFVCLFAGLLASVYSAYEAYNPAATSICSVSSQVSCGKVVFGPYATTAGVPNWAIGLGGFLAMALVTVLAYRSFDRRYLQLLVGLAGLGLLVSLYFVYTEVLVGAICLVCTSGHIADAAILGLSVWLLRLGSGD